jgi:hypothetical protein
MNWEIIKRQLYELPLDEISSSSMGSDGRGYGGTLGLPAIWTGGFDEESATFSCSSEIAVSLKLIQI